MTELNPDVSVITTNVIGLNSHIKYQLGFKIDLYAAYKQEAHLKPNDSERLRS